MTGPQAAAAGVADAPSVPDDPESFSTRLHGAAFWVALVLTTIGLVLAVNQVFNLGLGGFRPISTAYYYLTIGLFGAIAFLSFPARRSQGGRVPWFDWLLAAVLLGLTAWCAANAQTIIDRGWDLEAPLLPTLVAAAIVPLALELTRRTGETVLFVVCLVFASYPLYAGHMPGFLWGVAFDLPGTARAHVFGTESMIGIPMQVLSDTLIGFLVFGVVLANTGGGAFFMEFASALMGSKRGGPAKVAVVSSGLFGMLSGSPTSNVLTTGTLTIPTMKRCGYPATYAGAVEACASTGGALMPPVMGAAAFIMANFLNTAYAEVVKAAFLPAFLFYLALFVQTDLYAAKAGLRGMPPAEVPPLGRTLLSGWYYFFAIVGLTVLLLFYRIEAEAPFHVSLFLLAVATLRARQIGFGPRALLTLVVQCGQTVAQIVALLAGIGLIVGAMSVTGVANSFSRELVQYAGGNVYLLLLYGAITSFILGMGMTASACYIFLAIVLGPALVAAGLDPMAAHLYIFYWGIVSFITPPVALAAIAAASIARANAMRTGLTAIRIGVLLLLLPVLFALQPALILHGTLAETAQAAATAITAVFLLGFALEGHVYGLGAPPLLPRLGLGLGGLMMLHPGLLTDLAGLGLGLGALLLTTLLARAGAAPRKETPP